MRHDLFTRQMLRFPEIARPLLAAELPSAVAARLDWSSLRLTDTSYATEEGGAQYCDVVYEARIGGTPAKLTLLIEHKSEQNRHLALQLSHYRLRLWEQERREGATSFSVVVPLVIYHGASPWRDRPFEHQFGEVMEALQPFLPRLAYRLIDFRSMKPEEIEGRYRAIGLQMMARLLKLAAERGEGQEVFAAIRSAFHEFYRKYQGQELLRVWIRYLGELSASRPVLQKRLNQLNEPPKEEIMSALDEILAEGEAKGRAEGRVEGRVEGEAQARETIVRTMAGNGIEAADIARWTQIPLQEVQAILSKHS